MFSASFTSLLSLFLFLYWVSLTFPSEENDLKLITSWQFSRNCLLSQLCQCAPAMGSSSLKWLAEARLLQSAHLGGAENKDTCLFVLWLNDWCGFGWTRVGPETPVLDRVQFSTKDSILSPCQCWTRSCKWNLVRIPARSNSCVFCHDLKCPKEPENPLFFFFLSDSLAVWADSVWSCWFNPLCMLCL